MEILIQKVKVPFMIDSTIPEVIDLALPTAKSIINSVNLRMGRAIRAGGPYRYSHGALVVGTIDDDPSKAWA
ncbi:MAG: hypothetical protein R3B54_19220 [Bdellovibrionota bacterium]